MDLLFFAHRIGFGFIVLDVVMDDGSTLIVLLLLLQSALEVNSDTRPTTLSVIKRQLDS